MATINTKPFAEALRFFLQVENRPKKNLTQKKLAEIVGVTQGVISKIKNEKLDGREKTRLKIAQIYASSYDEFLEIGRQLIENGNFDPKKILKKSEKHSVQTTIESTTENGAVIKLHRGLISRFKNKKLAYNINRMLLEIENRDPGKLPQITAYIQAIYDAMDEKKSDMETEIM